jgi:hypothetical protein
VLWSLLGLGQLGVEGDVVAGAVAAARLARQLHLAEHGIGRQLAVPLDLYAADPLQAQPTVLGHRDAAGVALQRPGQSREATRRLEARIAGLLAAPHSAKERPEGAVELAQHGLLGPEIGLAVDESRLPQLTKLGRLIAVANRLAAGPPRPTALLERGVVELAGGAKLSLDLLALAARRIEPVAIHAAHRSAPPLLGDVAAHRALGDVTGRTGVPQRLGHRVPQHRPAVLGTPHALVPEREHRPSVLGVTTVGHTSQPTTRPGHNHHHADRRPSASSRSPRQPKPASPPGTL